MSPHRIAALDSSTWDDFARLAEANNGVWNGCWCLAFHEEGGERVPPAERRARKELRVREERAHAALVYDGDDCVGWCQFGPVAELPRIKNRRAYLKADPEDADWRITCFFVGKGHRRSGVASSALQGALDEIARLGGGLVESFPEDVSGRSTSASFLHNGTLALFERHGFGRVAPIGAHHWLVTKTVDVGPAAG